MRFMLYIRYFKLLALSAKAQLPDVFDGEPNFLYKGMRK